MLIFGCYSENHSVENIYEKYKQNEQILDSDNEDQDMEVVSNPCMRTARSERGLKKLSVKVIDLVYKLKETSYKQVANKLIEELVTNAENDNNGTRNESRAITDRKTKEEKNVRRRVYDALNVLIACGVLKKNSNKNVMYEDKPENRLKGLKVMIKKKHKGKKKTVVRQLSTKRSTLESKRSQLKESLEKLYAIKKLIKRNKEKEDRTRHYDKMVEHEFSEKLISDKFPNASKKGPVIHDKVIEKLKFPLVILSTPNTDDNEVSVCMAQNKRILACGFNRQFKVMGDMDMLLKLGYHENNYNVQHIQDSHMIDDLLNNRLQIA